jgi:hypothetical protein
MERKYISDSIQQATDSAMYMRWVDERLMNLRKNSRK